MVTDVKIGDRFWAWSHKNGEWELIRVEIVLDYDEDTSKLQCRRFSVLMFNSLKRSSVYPCNLFNVEDAIVQRLRGYTKEEDCSKCPWYKLNREVSAKG